MKRFRFQSPKGIELFVEETPLEANTALASIFSLIDTHKGAIFSSGFEYPGRHSRWDIGFADPALEFVSKGREFTLRALNDQGKALFEFILPALLKNPDILGLTEKNSELCGTIKERAALFTEEERTSQPSIFSVLRTLLDQLHFDHAEISHLGFYGAFGYDLIHQTENVRLTHQREKTSPDCHLFLPLEIIVVDRKKEIATNFTYSFVTSQGETKTLRGSGQTFLPSTEKRTAEIRCDHQPGEFAQKVQKIISGTSRGDYFEVVLSQSFHTVAPQPPTVLFSRLSKINPSPYMFLINLGGEQLIGASPEMFVRVTGTRYETCPIAGTITRGASAVEDADRVRQLIGSKKDESELTMCTDVDRNDMARVCIPGTVRVIGRRQLEFYSHLIHTVDHLEGTLAPEFNSLDAFQTHMWACTVTGAPKLAAMQTIEELENSPREWYSGAIGFLNVNGDINTGITLRTAHLKDGLLSIRAGATLLHESDPELEEQETRTKAAAFLAALAEEELSKKESPRIESGHSPALYQGGTGKTVLLVDYQDSFVHNLASYLRTTGAHVVTYRAGFPEKFLDTLKPDLVVLSPGPGAPSDFEMPTLLATLVKKGIPTFGVCLGHQGIGEFFGATLSTLASPVHGKASNIVHNNSALFSGISSPFMAGRYHSLYLVEDTIPNDLVVTAKSYKDDSNPAIVMAIQHKKLPIAGVQFHPESIMTQRDTAGLRLLNNVFSLLR